MTRYVALTFDEWPHAHSVAFPIMQARGLVGSWFVTPGMVGPGLPVARDSLIELIMAGWTIGAYSGENMVNLLAQSPGAALDHLVGLKQAFRDLGVPVCSLAANQRAWNYRLRNLCERFPSTPEGGGKLFDVVRVVNDVTSWQRMSDLDPLFINKGGIPSLAGEHDAAALNGIVDRILSAEAGTLHTFVIHKVGEIGDGSTVTIPAFTALVERLAAEASNNAIEMVVCDGLA